MHISEDQIEHSILEYLNSIGWFSWKNPTTGFHDGVNWRKQASPYAISGVSDIIAVKDSVVLFIEVKTTKGVQSPAQKKFEKKINQQRGNYFIVRSVAEMKLILKENSFL